LDDISCQPSDWNKRLRSFRVRVSAGGPNWAGCALLGRTHEDVLGCLMSLEPNLSYKAFSFTVSYDLSLILIVVMLKALIISVALIITSIMLINFHELCECF